MKARILAVVAALAVAFVAMAQVLPNLPSGTVWGRLLTGTGPGQAIPFSTFTGNLLSGISGNVTCSPTGVCTISYSIATQVFTSSGTYTPNAALVVARVTCTGGGAAGGGTPITNGSQAAAGGGGGSGGTAIGYFSKATIGSGQAVTIGAGGAGVSGANGNNGGQTTFGALLTATGGSAGPVGVVITASGIVGGAGQGLGSGGSVNLYGQTGYDGWVFIAGSTVLAQGGAGGISYWGGAGTVAATNSTVLTGVGSPGYGSGGGGAAAGFSQAAGTGGVGGSGICVVEEFLS